MEFSVKERLMLLGVMPGVGNLAALRLVRQASEDLGFDEDEHKQLKLVLNGNVYAWNDEAEAEAGRKRVDLGEVVSAMILKAFEDLDAENRLQMVQLELYERFIEAAQEKDEDE